MPYFSTGLGFANVDASGEILPSVFTGMPAAGPGPELSPDELAAMQAQARLDLARIGAPANLAQSAAGFVQANKTALMLGGGALLLFFIARGSRGR